MQTSQRAGQYYISCNLLWYVLSAIEYFHERYSSEEFGMRRSKWEDLAESLADWSLEECAFTIEHVSLSIAMEQEWQKVARAQGGVFFSNFSGGITAITDIEQVKASTVNISMIVYYAYCSTLRLILEEFDGVMQNIPAQPNVFYSRYQANIEAFTALSNILSGERLALASLNDPLQLTLETHSQRLADKWAEAVRASVVALDQLA